MENTTSIFATLSFIITSVISAVAVLISISNAKKGNYVSNVTNYRLKWIESLREYVANFCTYSRLQHHNEPVSKEFEEKKWLYYYKIQVHLNRLQDTTNAANFSKSIRNMENNIIHATNIIASNKDGSNLDSLLDNLMILSQELVAAQWNSVKKESSM